MRSSSREQRKQNLKKLAIGSTVAATAGYIVGLLTAGQSGKETREDIKSTANKGKNEAEEELEKLHTDLGDLIKSVKDSSNKVKGRTTGEFKERVAAAIDTKDKIKELISAVHDGDADDKDLKRAIKNANNAVEHLKDYLKK